MKKISEIVGRLTQECKETVPSQYVDSSGMEAYRTEMPYSSLWIKKSANNYSRLELETIRDLAG